MRRGRSTERGDNGIVEVRGAATTSLSVCTGRIGTGEEDMGKHKASRKIKRGPAKGDRY